MKIVGVLLILGGFGIFLLGAVGAGLYTLNRGSEGACSLAKISAERAEKLEKEIYTLDKVKEEQARSEYEAAKRTAFVDEAHCKEMKTSQKVYTIIGIAVAVFGLLLTGAGIGSILISRKRRMA